MDPLNIAKVLLSLRKLIIIRNVFYNTKTDRLYNIQDLSPSELCDVIEIMSMSRYQLNRRPCRSPLYAPLCHFKLFY